MRGLAVGWLLVPGRCYKTEDIEALGQISQNYSLFSEPDVDQRIDDILALPIEEQAAAWGELDKYISETYLPLIPLTYDGVISGARVEGQRSRDRPDDRDADLQEHLARPSERRLNEAATV